jgi:Beta-lactamase enzyme family
MLSRRPAWRAQRSSGARAAGRGRRSRRAPSPLPQAALIVVLACLVVAAIALTGFALRGTGGRPSAPVSTAKARHASATWPPAASPAPVRQHSDPLTTTAAAYLAARSGTVLAAVYDLRTGQMWQMGHGRPQPEASVVKLDVLETLLAQRGDSGAGLSPAERSLARLMVEDSDNDAATQLWNAVNGAAGLRRFNGAAGLADTSPSSCVSCPGFPWPGWGLTTTVPSDQIALLRQLVQPSRLLTPADRRYALSLMENVTPAQRWGITGGVSAGATVALKNGWLPLDDTGTDWQINSVGWVSGRGRNYLIAVLSTRSPTEQYGIDTVSRLGAIVWRAMR